MRLGVGEWIEGESLERRISSDIPKANKRRRPLFSFQFIENEEQGHFSTAKTGEVEGVNRRCLRSFVVPNLCPLQSCWKKSVT